MLSAKTTRWCAVLMSLSLMAWVGHYWFFKGVIPIYPYQAELDRTALVDMFKQNHFWLTTEENLESSVKRFEWQLDTLSSGHGLWSHGDLKVYVYRVGGEARAFIAYYPAGYSNADILYLVVNEKHRCQGCASALMNFALEDLKNCGFRKIELLTRLINERARGLYERFGFRESRREGPLVYYIKDL